MKNLKIVHATRLGLAVLLAAFFEGATSEAGVVPGQGTALREAIEKVTSRCPDSYPEDVAAIPTGQQLEKADTSDLMVMLESWNPVLRRAAAGELGKRGDEVIPLLEKAVHADQWQLREGALSAMINVIREPMRKWKDLYPGQSEAIAKEKIREKYSNFTSLFIEGTKDANRSVRHAALGGIQTLAPKTKEAVTAVLALCGDEDVYTAQGAMATLAKALDVSVVDSETVVASFKKAMRTPMPRGKAFIVGLIAKMEEADQRALVPELLYHLDWQPDRDTMFGAGGQAEAMKILTTLDVKELIPRIPALMTKTMRGPGLFEPCMDSTMAFGRDAKMILPDLRKYAQELEDSLATAHSRHRAGLEKRITKLKEAIKELERTRGSD